MEFDIGLDFFPLLAALLASICCGILGNFLVLRKQSMMGDAISHSVLPGLVIAFLIASTRSPIIMLAGALAAGIVTVILIEFVKRIGRVEPGAAMGVVFSIMFALGVLLIEKAAADQVDLDADCVLYGQLEFFSWWGAPESFAGLFESGVIDTIPDTISRPILTLLTMCILAGVFVTALFKELRLAAFDPELATTLGFNSTLLHYALMIFVAAATVSSFEAVGSILVIAMLICPAATARLLTDRLHTQILCSLAVAITASVTGYFATTLVPSWFGIESLDAAGSITVMLGFVLALTVFLSPSHGIISKSIRRVRLARRVELDDLLALVFRQTEKGYTQPLVKQVEHLFPHPNFHKAISRALRSELVQSDSTTITLTPSGAEQAKAVLRRHRLWEHYLVDRAGIAPDHVHDIAEQLEHFQPTPPIGPAEDPHGKSIP
jgi:manganese/zinc/iron transport system permease protein